MLLEAPSAWLMERRPDRLIFYWSTPTGASSSARNLADVAGFAFRRAGRPVAVFVSRGGGDAVKTLLTQAGGDPRTAILWLSNDSRDRDAVLRIGRDDPTWECRDFGTAETTTYACRR